jgi:hypothetical protein
MTLTDVHSEVSKAYGGDKASKFEEARGRRAVLTEEDIAHVQALHHRTASTIHPSRGRPSRIEGLRVGEQPTVIDVTGFPTERKEGQLHDDSQYPDPDGATARARELDRAERQEVLVFDVVAAPGVTTAKGDPDWPPEKQQCMLDSGDVVKFLVEKGAGIFRVSYDWPGCWMHEVALLSDRACECVISG